MTGAQHYRELLGIPHAKALIGWSLLARLPLGMTPFALLLLVRDEGGGYGEAGIVVAVYTIALGIGAPVRGRRVDLLGPAPVLRVGAVMYAVFLGSVVALALVDAATVFLAVAAALAGFLHPPIGSTVRIVWPRIAPGELRSTAYALEAALQEAFFVVGPLLAAALAVVEPTLAVGGAALASLVGTTALSRLPPVRETLPSRTAGAGLLGALGSAGVRTVVLYATAIGFAFGSVELAMPAFAELRVLQGARRDRARVLRGGEPARGSPRRDAPAARRCPPLPRRRARARRGLARAPARRVASGARGARLRRRPADCPDRRRALLRDRPHGTRGNRSRGVRLVRDGDLDRVRGRVGGGRRPRRGAKRALGLRFGAAVALAGAGVGWLRRDTFRAERVSTLSSSARSSGDRAADF